MEQFDKRTEQARNCPWNQRRRRGQNNSQAQRNKNLKVVLDTNILISAFFWKGNPHKILGLGLERKIEVFSSIELLGELKEAIMRDFDISEYYLLARINKALESIKIVNPVEKFLAVPSDPDDNKVLEAALEAKANFIISGDKHLLKLKEFKGIKILTAKEFLGLFGKHFCD